MTSPRQGELRVRDLVLGGPEAPGGRGPGGEGLMRKVWPAPTLPVPREPPFKDDPGVDATCPQSSGPAVGPVPG